MPNHLTSLRTTVLAIVLLTLSAAARAQSPQQFDPDATRYMALGDSIAAGYKAMPATKGYAYLLYTDGVFDRVPHTLFCNAAVVGATSADVLAHQVPAALLPAGRGLRPDFITLTVGGNDLASIRQFAATNPDPIAVQQFAEAVLLQFGQNLGAILLQLRAGLPDAKIFVSNQYSVPEFETVLPNAPQLFAAFNGVVAQAVGQFSDHVYLVDINSALAGRTGTLLIDRHGADAFEAHLTNLGHRIVAQAFADVIAGAQ